MKRLFTFKALFFVLILSTTFFMPVHADSAIGILFDKFLIWGDGSISADAINPKTGQEESYKIWHFPKNQYNNKAALETALKQSVLEQIESERLEEKVKIEAARLALRKQAFITKAKAVNKVTVDPKTGVWNFEYMHSKYGVEDENSYTDVSFRKRSFIPPNLIDPKVKSMVKKMDNGEFEYQYSISNGSQAKQFISKIFVGTAINLMPPLPQKTLDTIEAIEKNEQQFIENMNKRLKYSKKSTVISTGLKDKLTSEWFIKQSGGCKSRISSPKHIISWIFCTEKGTDYQWYAFKKNNKTGESDLTGIYPGERWDNLRLLAPYLPGVLLMHFEGFNNYDYAPSAILEVEGAAKDKLESLLNTIGKEVPVIAPQIAIPKPYNGAQLAQHIKAHVQTWIVKKPGYELQTGNELITAAALLNLNRQFDLLIPALERKDKAAVRDIAKEMLTQIFTPHKDLEYYKFFADDEVHSTKPKRTLTISADATVKNTAVMDPLHRVAARALGFNLMYLINRSEQSE